MILSKKKNKKKPTWQRIRDVVNQSKYHYLKKKPLESLFLEYFSDMDIRNFYRYL